MRTKNPQVKVVLERPLYRAVEHLAKRDGVAISLKIRDLVKEALEIEEDMLLSQWAETREKTFKNATLKHSKVW